MKPVILVPTDFSELARRGITYACKLAKHMKAEVRLLHVYHILPFQLKFPVILFSLEISIWKKWPIARPTN